MNKRTGAILAVLLSLYCVAAWFVTHAQPSTIRVTGTVYGATGAPASGIRIRFTPYSISGNPISAAAVTATTNASGDIQSTVSGSTVSYIDLVRGGTYRIEAPILGFSSSGGALVTLPNTSTADFSTLVTVTSYSSSGLTVKDEGTPLSGLFTSMNFVGGNVAVTNVAGVATVTFSSSGAGTVTDFSAGNLSPLFTSSVATSTSTPALTFTLSNQSANRIFAGPSTGSPAAPTFRALVSADIPDLSSVYQTALGFTPVPNTRTVNGHALSSNVTVTPSDLSLVIGTDVQAFNSNLSTYAGIAPSANVQTLLGAANYAAFKSSLSLNNVENTSLSTWAGSTNLTTLGTVSAGTWNGSVIGSAYGGAGSVNGILKANGSGTVSAASSGSDYVAPGAITGAGLTMATARLLGRSTASTGAIEEISIGSGLSLAGGTLSASGGSGATTALDNLASVSINASLIPQSAKDLGAAATAWRDLYLYGGGTFGSHSLKLTGTPTGNRTITIPNVTDTLAVLGTAQTFTAAQLINVSSATALNIGPNGATSPTLTVVTNVASAATGLEVKSNAAASRLHLTVLSSGSNEGATFFTKGTGSFIVNVNGTNEMTLTDGVASFTGTVFSTQDFKGGASGFFYWNGRSQISSPADSKILLQNSAGNDFSLLQFGGTSSSFPALKKSSATLQVRLADDSAFATIEMGIPKFSGTNTTGSGSAALGANSPAVTNTAPYTWIQITTSDGSTAFVPCWK